MEQVYEHFRSNEGLTSDRLALETLYGGKFASSTQLPLFKTISDSLWSEELPDDLHNFLDYV